MRSFVALLALAACSTGAGSPRPAAPPTNAAPVGAPPEPIAKPVPLHCFSWVHEEEFSTDCFRTAAICETERAQMEAGSRMTRPCQEVPAGSCTRVSRGTGPGDERCFGDANNCARYRAYVAGNGLTTTPCTGG